MEHAQERVDFCKRLADSYAFDGQVVGLEEIKDGATVRETDLDELVGSGRFKRSELRAVLAEEPNGMTLYMDTKDVGKSYVVTEETVYATTHPPDSLEGAIIIRPVPVGKRKLTVRDEIAILQYAA